MERKQLCEFTSFRKLFPHFFRWIKVSAVSDPSFDTAVAAREVLYNFLALKAKDIRPRRSFRVGDLEAFRPTAAMLTAVNINTGATVVDIPPLYDAQPFEAALRHGHGEFAFTTDNEVLYFSDKAQVDG